MAVWRQKTFISLILSILILLSGAFYLQGKQRATFAEAQVHPCSASPFNTCGWAWNDQFGWLSHNYVDDPFTPEYGVHLDEAAGTVSGYAWNDHLGYIHFDAVTMNPLTGELSGTAQILNLGADGTLFLRGECNPACGGYGVQLVGDQLTGHAWNDITGYIDFAPALGGVSYGSQMNPSLYGWAWNDSYGWISFSFIDYGINYGIQLEADGRITGYAWSDNLGWLRYDQPGPYPSEPLNSARWNPATGEVSGWLYSTNFASVGMDPWVKLRSSAGEPVTYGVRIDPGTGEWSGWAWSDEFGWLSYNHAYGTVMTQFRAEKGPARPLLENPLNCVDTYELYSQAALSPLLDWSDYAALDGTSQAAYQIQVDTDPLFSAPFIDETISDARSDYLLGLGELTYNTTYYWKVRVQSSNGDWSVWGEEGAGGESNCFRTPLHTPPFCAFDLNPSPPVVDQAIQFTDRSIAYGGANIAFWNWDFGDGETQFGSDPIENQNPQHTYTEVEDITISLNVIDSDGYECSVTSEEQVFLQLPRFREVIPRP